MGMFDRVVINCKNCNTEIELQSKAGDCQLDTYYLRDNIPEEIVNSILKESKIVVCPQCEEVMRLRKSYRPYLEIE